MDGDPQGAWAHSHQQLMHPQHDAATHNSYQSPATGGDPYHYHQQRNSGDYESYESYSSGGEDQQPTHSTLSPSPHHHPQQPQHPQPHQIYMQFDQPASGGSGASAGPGAAGGASPYATSHTKALDLYASPSPVGTAYTNPTTSDGRTRPSSSGGAYPASYASHSSQGVAAVQGGTRLTPVLEQFERLHYTNPLSPSGPAPQQQSVNSNNSAASVGYGSPPGPNRNTRMIPPSQPTSGGGPLPYGRPRPAHHAGGGHHSSHHRYGHQHNVSNGSSALSSASSQLSQPSPQQQQPAAAFPPSAMSKIFAPNPVLPPIGNSTEQPQQSAQHPPVKPRKEMVAGTPTHPDIPRPAIVAPPVPVPHLTKKSRGRQVPSVNSMSNAGNNTSVTSSHSSSRERRHDGRAGRERSYDGGLESPLSPHAPSGGYFPGTQWSDSEYEDGNPVAAPAAHAQRSLFGQPPVPMDSYGGNTQNGGPGSTSTASSPATSSSRRTVEDAGPTTSGGPGTLAAGSLEAELRSRPFVCTVERCGKAYIRAEHLKRHVRSIHTNDKRESFLFLGLSRTLTGLRFYPILQRLNAPILDVVASSVDMIICASTLKACTALRRYTGINSRLWLDRA
jgi:hypothetical protein